MDVDPATALREHLVETAEKLLSERQISAITTRDIALSAGVSDGVLTALLRRYQSVVERFDAGLPMPAPPRSRRTPCSA